MSNVYSPLGATIEKLPLLPTLVRYAVPRKLARNSPPNPVGYNFEQVLPLSKYTRPLIVPKIRNDLTSDIVACDPFDATTIHS